MSLIKNFDELARSDSRKVVLEVLEAGLSAIQPENFLPETISLNESTLRINNIKLDLNQYRSIRLLGFGKGSAAVAKYVEDLLGEKLTNGSVIDITSQNFKKVKYSLGTHPLPSEGNQKYTSEALATLTNLTQDDLCLVIICGGGSAMLTLPHSISIEELANLNQELLHSKATIQEINTVRKHLSEVQGGGLAKKLYPATVVSMICSDVPGNDLATIASGPLTKDDSSTDDALKILAKFNITQENLTGFFQETPKEKMYFENVRQEIILSNQTALHAMEKKAKELNIETNVLSDNLQADALAVGQILIEETTRNSLMLVGGETTLLVTGGGQGGRNQELVLAALPYVNNSVTIASIDSDGWDNSRFAGAIGDSDTLKQASRLSLNLQAFQKENNSYKFFEQVCDGINTGRLNSNVSDLMVLYKRS